MTPYRKLDKVLEYLVTFKSGEEKTASQIMVDLNLDDLKEMEEILMMLRDDGYALSETEYFSKDAEYTASFKGRIFDTNEGYQRQIEIENIKLKISENVESVRLRNDNRLVAGTWFAGTAAVLLLLWQIFLYFYPVHKDYPYFFWQ